MGGIEKLVKYMEEREEHKTRLTASDIEREFGKKTSDLIKKLASSGKRTVRGGYEIRVTSEFGAEDEVYRISLHERPWPDPIVSSHLDARKPPKV
jgi:hypothetical protein